MGRPTDYNLELAAEICARITEGQSLRSICKADDMPDCRSVFRWLALHDEFSQQYTHARDAQADTLADELLDIADDATNDWMDRETKNGSLREVDAEHITRSRLRIDTRKWIASKLKPKKYGDKLETQHTGANGGPIIISSIDAEL